MKQWKRIVTFLLVLAMLASFVPPVAAENYETITVNQEKYVDVDSNGSTIFSFTPTEEGYYSFYSTEYNRDPKASVYDSNMSLIYSDDDSGVNWNFEITWFAEAGQTYYLEARGTGTYTAYVVEKPRATSLELTCDAEIGYPDSGYYYYLNYELLPEGCFYETVTFSSSDEEIVSVNDYGQYFMLSPGTAVLTATSATGITASCTITVRQPETVGCDEPVTVYGEERERRLLFTPETTGWYGFYSTGDSIDTVGRLLDAEGVELAYNDDGEGYNFLIKEWLEEGRTYILRVDWGNYDEGRTAQLQVSALTAPEAMELNDTAFTGYVDATCQLYYSFSPEFSIPETVTWTSSDETVATVDDNGNIAIQGAGTAVITVTADCGLTATCTVTGKATPLVTCDDVMVKEANGDEELYKFIPETSGWYGFYSSNSIGNPYGIIMNEWFSWEDYNNDGDGMGLDFMVKAYLNAGQVYYLYPSWDGWSTGNRYEARIAPLTAATGLELSAETLTMRVGDAASLNAVCMPLLSLDEDVTWSSSDETVATVTDYGEISGLSAGTAVITATSENGLTASCTVTVNDLERIYCDQPMNMEVRYGDDECKLRFIPETSGWYGFYSSGDLDPVGYIYDGTGEYVASDDDGGDANNFIAKAWLEAGSAYTLEAYWYAYGDDRTLQLQVGTLSAAQSLKLYSTSESGYVTQERTLRYSFSPLLSIPEPLTWASNDESVATVNQDGVITIQGAGTAVITATSESGLTASCTVTGKGTSPVTCQDVILKTNREDELYQFIPETSGWYGFYSFNSNGDPYGGILNRWFSWISSNDNNGIDRNFMVKSYLEAGEVYYLNPSWNGWSSGEKYEARIELLSPATGLTISQETISKHVGDDFSLNVYFVPLLSINENVTWSSSDESVATVHEYGGSIYCLSAGTTVITATSESGFTASCTLTVKDLQTILCDQPVTVKEEDESCRMQFIPETSGWYGFYSTGNQLEPYGYIYDEHDNQVAFSDYNGYDNNFLAKAWLEAGKSYILRSGWNNSYNGYTAQLQMTALGAPTALTMGDAYIDAYAGTECWVGYGFTPMLSAPESVTWSSSDETVATVDEDGCIIIRGAGTALITITSESGLTATCTVIGRVAPEMTVDDVMVKNGNDEYELYKFIPETSGWYGFYSTGKQSDPYGSILNRWLDYIESNNDNGKDKNFMVKAYLEAGEVYYLYPGWYSWNSESSYEARIAPLTTATGLGLSQSQLTQLVSSRVTLKAYTVPLLAVPELVTWTSSDESVATVDGNGQVTCQSVGTAVITATTESGYQASCTVTVKAIPAISLDEILTLTAAEGECRYRFTAPQDGWYAFYSLKNELDTYGTLYAEDGRFLQENDDGGESSNFMLHRYLQAGESCILASRPYSSGATEGSYQIQVILAPEATGIQLSTEELEGFTGRSDWIGTELIPFTAVSQGLTWTSSDESVVMVNNYGNVEYVGQGTAVITATTGKGLTASCTVTVKPIRDIALGDTLTLAVSEGRQMFRFIPAVTDLYRFYSTGEQADPWCEVRNSYHDQIAYDSDSVDGNNFSICIELTAGETYYFSVKAHGEETATYQVHLQEAVEATGIQLSETAITGQPGDRLTLTATLQPSNATPQKLFWESSDESVAYMSGNQLVLKGEGTATITVRTSAGLTASCQVTVSYGDAEPIECDQPTVVYAADGHTWFSFVPKASGWYRFFSESTADPMGTLYDENRNELESCDDYYDSDSDYNFSISYELTAGETYYLRVKFFEPDPEDSCTVTLEQLAPGTGIVLSHQELLGYPGDILRLNAHTVPEFAIPEAAVFTTSNEDVATVDEWGHVYLHAVGTAVITATTESGLSATCTVTVRDPQPIAVNETVTVDMKQYFYRLSFTPETSGWYGFYTTGDVDTYGYLEDGTGKWIGEAYDGAEGENYMLRCYLEAGETYYLTSCCEYGSEETYTLTAINLTKPTGIQIVQDQMMAYPGCGVYPDFFFQPFNCYPEKVRWSSSDSSVVNVEFDGEIFDINAVGPGTAQLTVTSESGLTATVTVVVLPEPEGAEYCGRAGDNLLFYLVDGVLTFIGSGDMYDGWVPGGTFGKVELPEGLTSIGSDVLMNRNLGEVVIPSTVRRIGYNAFRNSTVASFHFKGSAPDIQNKAFYGVTTTAFYPAEDPTWTEEIRQNYGGSITWVPYYTDEPDAPDVTAGVTVSGSVTTGAAGDTTVELLSGGNVVATATVSGKTGTYSFTDVAPGSYTLRISKLNHVTREYELTVDAVDAVQDVKIHLKGDINGDGRVTVADVSKAYAHTKKATLLTGYEFEATDVNGDGRISVADVSKLYAHSKKTTLLW